MVPIGIVTRDRVAYLHLTLRSLSATKLPDDVSLTVYDDCSGEHSTYVYYTSNIVVQAERPATMSAQWRRCGLSAVDDAYKHPVGIAGKVIVKSLGWATSYGVVDASCSAISDLFESHPQAPGVFLLQDDVIFNVDWYTRMLDTVARSTEFTDEPVGLLAGIKLNQKFDVGSPPPLAVASGITAQCLYITRQGFDACHTYFNTRHFAQCKFDDTLRRTMTASKMWAGCIYPFVCQHIGVESLVRPHKTWSQCAGGRIGYHSSPPYVMASTVKKFAE